MSKSKAPLLIIFITVFIDLLGFGIVLPLLPRYARHFEASGQTLGLLMASFSAMQFVFAPLWGRVSDRVGRRPVLMLGLAGSTVFYGLFGYATSLGVGGQLLGLGVLPWLFICRIGAGIAGATIPTAQAYIADVTGPTERAKGMALIGAAFGIGFTFGPLLGAAFVSSTFGDMAALASEPVATQLRLSIEQKKQIATLVTEFEPRMRLGKISRQEYDKLHNQRDAELLTILTTDQQAEWKRLSAPSAAPGYVASVLSCLAFLWAVARLPESLRSDAVASERHWLDTHSLQLALARPAIGLILLTTFLTTFAFAQFESTLSLLTFWLGLPDRSNYYVFAYIGFILSLSQGVLVRRLVPRVGEFTMAVVGTVLMTAGLAAIGYAGQVESMATLYCVLPIAVVGFSALTPSLQSLLSRRTEASDQGGMLGLGQSISALARILGPWIGLQLNEKQITLPYWVGAGIMTAGVLLTLLLRSERGRAKSEE